jgi:hypothetical protein
MPAAKHHVFLPPSDPNVPIWRYMDFTKFVSLLEVRSLYFARADKLGDPFEGSYSRRNQELRPLVYKEIHGVTTQVDSYRMSQIMGRHARWQRKWSFVNCWHMNYVESAGMWRLYARSHEAVAIRSTYMRLSEVLDNQTYVGMVNYIDYERDWLPEGNTFYPLVHKRKSFSHESEIRAVYMKLPRNSEDLEQNKEPEEIGIPKPVDIDRLIESIYVAPTAPSWFTNLVHQVCQTYAMQKPVIQSALDSEPFY